ncbi:MAG TPA: CBS and ACT domain-containing protein [Spirochaetia bacterium]|nr:CBS and ACT domain-containing protein [Spirochaetia bacterium]
MNVGKIMTHNPFTVATDTPVTDAQALMSREKVHRLPVLDRQKNLVGIVAETDLLKAAPSEATTLNMYEMFNLLSQLTVKDVMTKTVHSVTEDTLIEDAARMLVDYDIGGVPVVRGSKVVGIVTESDIFKLFIELFGTRRRGIRATSLIPDQRAEIAHITAALFERGGNIISIGTFPGDDPTNAVCIIKADEISLDDMVAALKPFVIEVLDIRET